MSRAELYNAISDLKDHLFILFDEFQYIFTDDTLLEEIKGFFRHLANKNVSYVAVGTFKLLDLRNDSEELNSPFNKAAFVQIPFFRVPQMVDLFKWYKERCNVDGIPNELQSKIITTSCGHPASFMILLKLYHQCRPTVDNWRSELQLKLEEYMNSTHFKIKNALQKRSQEDQACIRDLIGNADGLDTSLQKIGEVEKYLLNIGVLVQSDDKISFTSEIILRLPLASTNDQNINQ